MLFKALLTRLSPETKRKMEVACRNYAIFVGVGAVYGAFTEALFNATKNIEERRELMETLITTPIALIYGGLLGGLSALFAPILVPAYINQILKHNLSRSLDSNE